ncbi:MAG: T9SS type A sorting domain-containing protein, partial [Ignavibacteria bacterium]|nr:T9SS type A sorting domain-containing protein [Ignavibacteria bacterium]
GREVAQLVKGENVQAGIHEVKFDASKLASGVYFYKLETPDFTETKKMMLVK